ncbi:MAG: FAD:protein FMN transferase [Ilumatobacteraceae bacterium]|nr:FAD:protein FMN transferase [Ilumatobacteraceae bacterium]
MPITTPMSGRAPAPGMAPTSEPVVLQRDFRVMGCSAHLVVHGGTELLLAAAVDRLRELESWWSRFREDSDITVANRRAGLPTEVHEDTLAVVARAMLAWRQTAGKFDITTLPAVLAAGYTHSATSHQPAPALGARRIGLGALVAVDYEAGTLTVPPGGAIDLGGIGKGFAADLVAEELVEAGATGALVNLGGDIALAGTPGDAASWHLGIDDPRATGTHVATLRMACGGIATSGTTVRRWEHPDGTATHHLIDPATGRPASYGIRTITVLAADAATAESFTTAAMTMPPAQATSMIQKFGLAALVVTDDDEVLATTTFEEFRA